MDIITATFVYQCDSTTYIKRLLWRLILCDIR